MQKNAHVHIKSWNCLHFLGQIIFWTKPQSMLLYYVWNGPKIQDLILSQTQQDSASKLPYAAGLSPKKMVMWGTGIHFIFFLQKSHIIKTWLHNFVYFKKKSAPCFLFSEKTLPYLPPNILFCCFWDTKVALTAKIGPNGIHVLFNSCWIKVALKRCIFKVSCFVPISAVEAGRKERDILACATHCHDHFQTQEGFKQISLYILTIPQGTVWLLPNDEKALIERNRSKVKHRRENCLWNKMQGIIRLQSKKKVELMTTISSAAS